jgi:hypothetical protein
LAGVAQADTAFTDKFGFSFFESGETAFYLGDDFPGHLSGAIRDCVEVHGIAFKLLQHERWMSFGNYSLE